MLSVLSLDKAVVAAIARKLEIAPDVRNFSEKIPITF